MDYGSDLLLVFLLLLAGFFTLTNLMLRQGYYQRRLDKKIEALLKYQGIEWPTLSPAVQALALDATKKIAAIKLHREENLGMSIAEAKAEVDAFQARN